MKIPESGIYNLYVSESATFYILAIIYFFFNSLFLPEGLLYTGILTPFFLWWLYCQNELKRLFYFFLFTLPFLPLHVLNGIELSFYIRSYLYLFSSVVFGFAFYVALKRKKNLGEIMKIILVINFSFTLIAIITLIIPSAEKIVWYLNEFSPGTGIVPRLKLFSYEASYYAFLLAPVAIYYYLKLLMLKNKYPSAVFIMITIPLLLSMSMGVLTSIAFTFIILFIFHPIILFKKKSNVIILLSLLSSGILITSIYFILYPSNPLIHRLNNIFTGNDTSFRGRTYESFILAWKIVKQKSIWFGCGPGQPKLSGIAVFKSYYGYNPPTVRIPNSLADTLATYGMIGLLVRLFFTVYFFFRNHVRNNYFQLAMFLFIFIYQFTGSFITNVAEYTCWILAFSPVFNEFAKVKVDTYCIQVNEISDKNNISVLT